MLPTVTEHPSAQSASSATQHGCYSKFTSKQKATIGNYTVLHGPSTTLYFKKEFPALKWSTVNDWNNAIVMQKRINASQDQQAIDIEELVVALRIHVCIRS